MANGATKQQQSKGHSRSLIRYTAYNFKDKDPVIDELRTLFQNMNHGRLDGSFLAEVERNGGPTSSCMRAWFFGETKKPQNPTIEAAGRAMGYRRKWVRWSGDD
jgi:hypothetical protein